MHQAWFMFIPQLYLSSSQLELPIGKIGYKSDALYRPLDVFTEQLTTVLTSCYSTVHTTVTLVHSRSILRNPQQHKYLLIVLPG